VQTRFEIVWCASPAAAQILLRSTTDANEATIAFLAELARLKRQAAPGELLVRTGDRTRPPLMRQPLTDQGERDVRRPRAPRARTIRFHEAGAALVIVVTPSTAIAPGPIFPSVTDDTA
jgi:hypothetical protein